MNNDLYHHGIKGQKWGVRRFQNKDGSLTAIGRKRSASNSDEHEDYKKAHSGKNIKSMSDSELREINNRLQMERQYRNLTEKEVSSGKKFVKTVVIGSATTVATMYATNYMKKGATYVEGIIKKKGATYVEGIIKKKGAMYVEGIIKNKTIR